MDKAKRHLAERSLTGNAVRGRPGWYYGLRIRHDDGSVSFDVFSGSDRIENVRASPYRTTRLARYMGEKTLRGYQHEARRAIDQR